MPLQDQGMNVLTVSELVIFFQVTSGNKGPSVGFVEVRGAPGDPVILCFCHVFKNPQRKNLQKINCF